MTINMQWSDLKAFATTRTLSIQWVIANNTYYLAAIDGSMEVTAQIPMDGSDTIDQTDFETNYKSNGNQSPIGNVRTQFEQTQYLLQMSHLSTLAVAPGTSATMTLQIPGTFNGTTPPASGRYIDEGIAWSSPGGDGDTISQIEVVDIDNILGQGANFVVATYFDSAVPSANQGWALNPVFPLLVDTIGWYGFIPSGLYISVTVNRSASATVAGNFYVNLKWGILT